MILFDLLHQKRRFSHFLPRALIIFSLSHARSSDYLPRTPFRSLIRLWIVYKSTPGGVRIYIDFTHSADKVYIRISFYFQRTYLCPIKTTLLVVYIHGKERG